MDKFKCKIGFHNSMIQRIRIGNKYRWITYCKNCDLIQQISEPSQSWQMRLANSNG